MTITREAAYNALLALLSTTTGIVIDSRRIRLFQDVSPTQIPALFLRENENEYTQRRGFPPLVTLSADIFIYIKTAMSPNVIPATAINTLLDAVDVALKPDDQVNFVQTLGGTVSHCWIEGTVNIEPGDVDPNGEGVAIIPIKILINH